MNPTAMAGDKRETQFTKKKEEILETISYKSDLHPPKKIKKMIPSII